MDSATKPKNFYQQNAQSYFTQTAHLDPSAFLQPLVKHLPPGARLLDIGCGSGRDLLWLKARGFVTFGLEGAPALAKLAHQHAERPLVIADFAKIPFKNSMFDAISAVGSFVHVAHADLPGLVQNLLEILRPGGFLNISLKLDLGENQNITRQIPDGRVFYLWNPEKLEAIFAELGLEIIEHSQNQSKIRSGELWGAWVLRLAKN